MESKNRTKEIVVQITKSSPRHALATDGSKWSVIREDGARWLRVATFKTEDEARSLFESDEP